MIYVSIYVGACFIRESWCSKENILSKSRKPCIMSCSDTRRRKSHASIRS